MTQNPADETAVDYVAQVLYRQIGLRPEPAFRGRLSRCLGDDAASYDEDVTTYVDTLRRRDEALQSLLNRVTVQETRFFRHPEQFEVLTRFVLPSLRQPIRIWSAGCAYGQEPFSLAMVLDECGLDGKVIASDVSTAALQRTAAARYTTRELAGLSPTRIARHLARAGAASWEINQPLRDRVRTIQHNLIRPLPEEVRSCQLVFCRNLLIYFSAHHARAFLDRLADALPSDAYLFLGSTESIWPVSDRFEAVRHGDTYIYRPRPDSTSTPPTPTSTRRRPQHRPDAGRTILGGPPDGRRERQRATPRRTTSPTSVGSPPAVAATPAVADSATAVLARAGEDCMTAGDHQAAVIAFRKWLYLAPDDAIAHLHLGLALEASGDRPSAQRAYGAARRALLAADPASIEDSLEGYTKDELLRLVHSRQQAPTP